MECLNVYGVVNTCISVKVICCSVPKKEKMGATTLFILSHIQLSVEADSTAAE
jgi:hypothetical protein